MLKPYRIYCDGQNDSFAQIAIDTGFAYGIRVPYSYKLDHEITFVDVDWKKPKEDLYFTNVKAIRPKLASMIDITDMDTYYRAGLWAQELIDYVEHVIFIPKIDIIDELPKYINGKEVILGYSVPSSYGKTDIPFKRLLSHRVHLLGGSPHVQMRLYLQYPDNIYSVDGNYKARMATKQKRYWVAGTNTEPTNRFWLRDTSLTVEEVFTKSCRNVLDGWEQVFAGDVAWLADRRYKRNLTK